jgi:hypothetical protein
MTLLRLRCCFGAGEVTLVVESRSLLSQIVCYASSETAHMRSAVVPFF